MTDLIGTALIYDTDREARILIIDDEPGILSVLSSLLGEAYQCRTATSANEALEHLREETYDLVLSDIMMPGMSGLDLLQEITRLTSDTVVILISGNLNIQSAVEAMRRGAFDYVTKPFNLSDVETAVARALRHHALLKANRRYEQHLEELVGQRTSELSRANSKLNTALEKLRGTNMATLRALATALEARDVETRGHSGRVVANSLRLGIQLGLSDSELMVVEQGALLHDIGKIGVPDSILLKPGALTEEEWVQMRRHVDHGLQILRGIDFLEGAAEIVGQHHEQYDGSGYPNNLKGEQICIGARIFAVADAIDAITSDRPYRAGRPIEVAAQELIRCAGKHFDPVVVQAFQAVPLDTWAEIRRTVVEPRLPAQDHTSARDIRDSLITMAGGPLMEKAR